MIRRLWTVLRQVGRLPATWVRVDQNAQVDAEGNVSGGWTHEYPMVAPDLSDLAIARAIATGKNDTQELRRLTSAGIHPRAEEGR